MSDSRTEHSIKNIKFGLLLQICNIIFRFLVRTVFVKTLGAQYLGIGSVFNNVFSVLSLAELGIGTAITYDMYKPIAENNEYKVKQMVSFYQKIYYGIGLFVLLAGIFMIPFLDYILTDISDVNHIIFIFILHIVYASSSYFFAHYRSLFSAYQLERENSKNNLVFAIILTAGELFALAFVRSYIIYMFVQIACSLMSNLVISLKAKKEFRLLKLKVEPLPSENIKGILRNAMSMLSISFGLTVVNSTDNLMISALISTVVVGVYGNYSLIISMCLTTMTLLSNSLIASVGNLCVEHNHEKMYCVFRKIRCGFSCAYGILTAGMGALLSPFIEIWLGEDYILESGIVLVVVLNFYLAGIRQPLEEFIYADGLFRHFQVKPWIEATINLIISYLLAKQIGLIGVFLGTTISHVMTTLWYDSYVVYKFSFGKKIFEYFLRFLWNLGWTILAFIVSCAWVNRIYNGTIIQFIISVIGTGFISVATCCIFNYGNKEFRELIRLIQARCTMMWRKGQMS